MNLSLYRSRNDKKKNKINSCGCASGKRITVKNSSVDFAHLVQSDKCSQFLKSRGKRHKLCLGQSKGLRRRRLLMTVKLNEMAKINNHNQLDIFEQEINNHNQLDIFEQEINNHNQLDIFEQEIFHDCTLVNCLDIFPSEPVQLTQGNEFQSETINSYDNKYDKHLEIFDYEKSNSTIQIDSARITTSPVINYILTNRRKETQRDSTEREPINPPININRHEVTASAKKINNIVDKLMDRDMLKKLVTNLEKKNLTKDFLYSVQGMSEGILPVDSIPHLSHLETVRFHRIKDTRRMWYSKKMKKFWHCFYKVGGGPPLRLLSGPKGSGSHNYEPSMCNINFAVPSINTIRSCDRSVFSKIIPPGIFFPVIENISKSTNDKQKEFILSYDGKSVGTGLKGRDCGDVNLWGFESEPNLKKAHERLEEENDLINKLGVDFHESDYVNCLETIHKVIAVFTGRIKNIRKIIDKCKKIELKYQKADLENPKYKDKHQYTIQGAKYLADNCKAVIHRALNVNRELCDIASHINRTQEMLNRTGIMYFHQQPNLRILLEPDEISDFFDECDNTVYVKQRSEIWKRIREHCAVTGSTLNKAIGLGTLQDQKDHYDYKFGNKQPPEPPSHIQEMLNYGTENEVCAIFFCAFWPCGF